LRTVNGDRSGFVGVASAMDTDVSDEDSRRWVEHTASAPSRRMIASV
jgi:hypothetical protein